MTDLRLQEAITCFQALGQTAPVEDLPRLAREFRAALTSPYDLGTPRLSFVRKLLTQNRGLPVPAGWPRLPIDAPLPGQIP